MDVVFSIGVSRAGNPASAHFMVQMPSAATPRSRFRSGFFHLDLLVAQPLRGSGVGIADCHPLGLSRDSVPLPGSLGTSLEDSCLT